MVTKNITQLYDLQSFINEQRVVVIEFYDGYVIWHADPIPFLCMPVTRPSNSILLSPG